MEAVFGLMVVVLLGVSHGIETYCDGRKNGTQCYEALGGTLVLQLMDDATKINNFNWRKNQANVLRYRSNNSKIILSEENRFFFTPSNGTLRINNLRRNDGGEYTLSIISENGERSAQQSLHLFIQAPVSSVLLDSECLFEGEMRVSCSSEGGDSPQYNWTLDGRTLTDAELLSGNTETNIITLKQHVSGHLVCSVRNKVSHVSSSKRLCTCGFIFINCTLSDGTHISTCVFEANNTLCIEPPTSTAMDSSLIICSLKAAVVIILLIGITIFFAWKKKKSKIAEGSADPRTMDHPENSVLMVQM
ncbi:carcinoembryonic antigen-related cell adhesion molecule 7-like [Anabas testudineus]|uniref:carcinoembryonic antigen-related cell adhesion molecule 7-like n=1 Tax=Anabas testudineus TaxID=64144 RepID=UPI000E460BA3|nr:carcinoembryonic antigen-related cell adhesion molecule 7-like [Anabas testudineus]